MRDLPQMLVQRSNDRGYLVGSRGQSVPALLRPRLGLLRLITLSPHYVCSRNNTAKVHHRRSYGSQPICRIRTPRVRPKLVRAIRIFLLRPSLDLTETKVPDVLNFSGEDQPSAGRAGISLVQIRLSGWTVNIAAKTAYGFVKGLGIGERIYQNAGVETSGAGRLCQVKRTGQHQAESLLSNYMDVYDFTHRSNIQLTM